MAFSGLLSRIRQQDRYETLLNKESPVHINAALGTGGVDDEFDAGYLYERL